MSKYGIAYEILAGLVLLTFVHLLSNHFQSPLQANNGRGWDGVWYCQMAEQIANRRPVTAPAPFVYRIGLPFLASRARDVVHGFLDANLLASYITASLLVIWFRLTIRSAGLRWFFFLLFLSNWLAPSRLLHVYPITVDAWVYPFVLGVLLLTHALSRHGHTAYLILIALLCAMGVLVRETVALVAIVVPFADNPLRLDAAGRRLAFEYSRRTFQRFLPALGALAVVIAVSQFVHPQGRGGGFLSTAVISFYSKSWLAYCHSWFIAFGPILFIPIFHWRDVLPYFSVRQYQGAYLAALIGVTLVGPPDIERHVLVGLPIVYTLTAHLVEKHWKVWKAPLVMSVILASQILASRLFFDIAPDGGVHPAYVLLTPLSNRTPWLDLFPVFAIPRIAATSFWEYVLLGTSLLFILRSYAGRDILAESRRALKRANQNFRRVC